MSEDIVPPVPPECNLRGLPWMPVEVDRLMNSDLWALSTPEEFKVAFRMWMKAWAQVPAASLPDDDTILAELSGKPVRVWKKLRPMALRGFRKATDGRLYHPVIAEKAAEAWRHRLAQREKADRRWGKATGAATADAAAQAAAMQGTGTVKGHDLELPSDAARRPGGETVETWNAYAAAYQNRWGVAPTRNAMVNGQLAKFLQRVPVAEAPDIAAFFLRSNKGFYVSAKHPVNLLLRDAEALRTEWLTGRQTTETEARQADKTGARAGVFGDLLEEARERERKIA